MWGSCSYKIVLIKKKECKGSSPNFSSNVKRMQANWLTSIPPEIIA